MKSREIGLLRDKDLKSKPVSGGIVTPIQVDGEVLTELRTDVSGTRKAIEEHVSDFRVFVTKLFGDDEKELPTGRIPKLEAGHANHEKRIRRIETLIVMAAGGLLIFKGIAMLAEVAYHVAGAVRH